MAQNYHEEYYQSLERCVKLVYAQEKYRNANTEYLALKKEIDGLLESENSFCSDAERLIDTHTGGLKVGVETIVGGNTTLLEMLERLGKLHLKKQAIAQEYGWQDEVIANVSVVLAIGKYEEIEKKIFAELGARKGEETIYEQVKKAVEFEKELGVYFFADKAKKMEELFRIRTLYSPNNEVELTKENNFTVQKVFLVNLNGEKLAFEKMAQVAYAGQIYLELVYSGETRIRALNYYKVKQTPNGQQFLMEEDENIFKILWDLVEKESV